MVNLYRSENLYKFSVNGGDAQATKMGLWLPGLLAVVLGGLYGQFGGRFVSPDFLLYGWIGLGVLIGLISVFVLISISKGKFSRFIVKIDLETAEISAYDRIRSESIWTSDFYPEYLYLSEILVDINGEEYTYPALVYAEEKYDFVEEAVPYPDRVILGYAEQQHIENVIEQIHQYIAEQ